MRYLVKARVKSGKEKALAKAIQEGTLGQGSIAGDEYLDDMEHARLQKDGTAVWVEVCYCADSAPRGTPLLGRILRVASRSRTLTHAAIVVMKMAPNCGPAATAPAQSACKNGSKHAESHFWRVFLSNDSR